VILSKVMIESDLPLIELHRHLDGNVRLATILDLGREHNLPLPAWDLEGLRPHVQVTVPQPGVMAFIAKFEWLTGVMVNYDACRRIAYENMEDAKREGMDYIELRFSPWFMVARSMATIMAEAHALDPAGVTEAVVEGIQAGRRDFSMKVNLIGILSRTYGPVTAAKELRALSSQREHIVALDLAGDEANFPGELFREHFRTARDNGWHVTVHAGESAGAESIWQAIRELGAERIGHALRAVDDPTLMDYMAEQRIGVESCLTSNVQTSCVPDYPSHPLKTFLEHGIHATINSDDPGISGIDLHHEYEVAAPNAGLTQAQIRQAQANALETAFLTEGEKRSLQSQVSSSRLSPAAC
jgi:adenosine deaminase